MKLEETIIRRFPVKANNLLKKIIFLKLGRNYPKVQKKNNYPLLLFSTKKNYTFFSLFVCLKLSVKILLSKIKIFFDKNNFKNLKTEIKTKNCNCFLGYVLSILY